MLIHLIITNRKQRTKINRRDVVVKDFCFNVCIIYPHQIHIYLHPLYHKHSLSDTQKSPYLFVEGFITVIPVYFLSAIAACGAIRKRGRLLYAQSTVSFCDRKKNRSFFAFLARLIGGMAAEILFSVGICKNHTVTTVMMVNIVSFV